MLRECARATLPPPCSNVRWDLYIRSAPQLTATLNTPRLKLRAVALADATFFLRLLNEPSWLENIGDRGVRSHADADRYIRNNIWSQYESHGYGMYVVETPPIATPIGLCGLVKREFLSSPDLGFALLPDWVGRGYAAEAACAVIAHAESRLGIEQLYAIVNRSNRRSLRLLERLGFRHEGAVLIPPAGEEVERFVRP
jgi:ribosomal-protein-alanine N-acetyltransferase